MYTDILYNFAQNVYPIVYYSKILTLLCTTKYSIMMEDIFCHYWLQSFSTVQILERHVNDCFEINVKQIIKMAKNGKTFKFKNHTKKVKSPFVI